MHTLNPAMPSDPIYRGPVLKILFAAIVPALVIAFGENWTAGEWNGVIAAIVGGSVAVIGATAAGAVMVIKALRGIEDKVVARVDESLAQVAKTTNGNLTAAITQVAKEVRAAEKSNVLESTSYPTTPEEIQKFAVQTVILALKQHQADQAPKVQT